MAAILVGGSLLGGWLMVRAISDAICGSYNFISNDICDEWHYDPPPADQFPLPTGWTIVRDELSCGSGGCPTHVFVVRPERDVDDSVEAYVDGLRDMGWQVRRGGKRDYHYFIGRKGDLILSVQLSGTTQPIAQGLAKRRDRVEVDFSLKDEAAVLYE